MQQCLWANIFSSVPCRCTTAGTGLKGEQRVVYGHFGSEGELIGG